MPDDVRSVRGLPYNGASVSANAVSADADAATSSSRLLDSAVDLRWGVRELCVLPDGIRRVLQRRTVRVPDDVCAIRGLLAYYGASASGSPCTGASVSAATSAGRLLDSAVDLRWHLLLLRVLPDGVRRQLR